MLSAQNFLFPSLPLDFGAHRALNMLSRDSLPASLPMKAETQNPMYGLLGIQTPLAINSLPPMKKFEEISAPNPLLSGFLRDQSEKAMLRSLNQNLTKQLETLRAERDEILARIKKCEEKKNQLAIERSKKSLVKRKRQRRLAKNIIRLFQCPDAHCQKSYGSEFSLNQHFKAKHPEKIQELMDQINQTLRSNPSE